MVSRKSAIVMKVGLDQTFSDIASEYGRAGHAPPNGSDMRYGNHNIIATDTPRSLGLVSDDIINVSW